MAVGLLQYSDIEAAHDDPDRIGRLAGCLTELRDADTLVVGTGDNTGPGVLSLVSGGRQALAFFRRVGPDVDVPGNHDFDHGVDGLRTLIDDSPQAWVCANVPSLIEADIVSPAVVRSVGSRRIGLLGLLDPATPSITPEAAGLTVTDPIEAGHRTVADLRSRGVDQVVVLSHTGRDAELAHELDVDLVLGGHVHDETIERIGGTLITRPGENAATLIECRLDGTRWRAVRHDVDAAPLDEGVAAALRDRRRAADVDEVVGRTDGPFDRRRDTIESGAADIGGVVAAAYRWATGADVGLQNSGGIRSGPPLQGRVTAGDLIGIVPFDEPVTVAELTGAGLRAVLGELRRGSAWTGYQRGAECTWTADGRLDTVRIAGGPLDPSSTYTLATSDYLFYTDREFPSIEPSHRDRTTDRPQYRILTDYVERVGLDGPPFESPEVSP